MSNEITQFRDGYRWLSNFGPGRVIINSTEYPTREHAYQAQKTTDRAIRLQVADLPTPGVAKRFGQGIEMRPDWERVKKIVMLQVVLAAFHQNPDLALNLAGTGDAYLEEGNTWHDNYWGACGCSRHTGHGLNYLGRILMAVRDVVKVDE